MLFMLQLPTVELPANRFVKGVLSSRDPERSPVLISALGGYEDLRKSRLPEGDAELRLWMGWVSLQVNGFRLRKSGDEWTAARLFPRGSGRDGRNEVTRYTAPKSGWPAFLQKMDALGVWTLPDESALPQENRQLGLDGYSDLVELQRSGVYRAYSYGQPYLQKQWPEAQRLESIFELLNEEFPYRWK